MVYTKVPETGDSVGKALIATDFGIWVLALVSIVLRIWARRVKGQTLRFDDYCVFVALLSSIGIAFCHLFSVLQGGLGLPVTEVTPESLALSLKLIPPAEVCWSISNTAVKLSFLYFFATVFSLEKYRLRFRIVGGLCISLGVANIIQALAICRPFAFQWDKTIPGGVCGEQDLGILLVAFFNLFTDVAVFTLPVPILWSLRVSRRKRGGLLLIFCLGAFVCCITILRIAFTFLLINDPSNETYWVGINALFLMLEPCLGIMAASMPTWKPLLAKQGIKPVFMPSSGDRSTTGRRTSKRNTKSFIRLNELHSGHGSDDSTNNMDTIVEGGMGTFLDTSSVHESSKQSLADGIKVTTEVDIQREARDEEIGSAR